MKQKSLKADLPLSTLVAVRKTAGLCTLAAAGRPRPPTSSALARYPLQGRTGPLWRIVSVGKSVLVPLLPSNNVQIHIIQTFNVPFGAR